jgi:hypothetical protein
MIRCKEVATLLSTDQVASQPVSRRIAVRFHLMMCRHCRRFARQLRMLTQVAANLGARFENEVGADFEQRLHMKLRS